MNVIVWQCTTYNVVSGDTHEEKRRYIMCTETLAILPEASWCFEVQLLGVGSPPTARK